jgi:hypothetical protein
VNYFRIRRQTFVNRFDQDIGFNKSRTPHSILISSRKKITQPSFDSSTAPEFLPPRIMKIFPDNAESGFPNFHIILEAISKIV